MFFGIGLSFSRARTISRPPQAAARPRPSALFQSFILHVKVLRQAERQRYTPSVPVSEYRYKRRVQFADTDLAGVVHFSWIAKYMEEAEHALWRDAGLSIVPQEPAVSFRASHCRSTSRRRCSSRTSSKCTCGSPPCQDDHVTYAHTIRRGDTVIATGTMTAVCVRKSPPPMKAVEIPAEILAHLGFT
jgi:acyl-CoA thioesterase FadM